MSLEGWNNKIRAKKRQLISRQEGSVRDWSSQRLTEGNRKREALSRCKWFLWEFWWGKEETRENHNLKGVQSSKIILRWAKSCSFCYIKEETGAGQKQITKMQNRKNTHDVTKFLENERPGRRQKLQRKRNTSSTKMRGRLWAAHMQKDLEKEENSTLKVNAKEAVIPVISEATDL